MLAKPWQVHHEGMFKLAVNILLYLVKVLVTGALGELGSENFFPVGSGLNFFHALARNQRARPRGGLVLADGSGVQVLIIKIEGLVVVLDLRHIPGLLNIFANTFNLAADARFYITILLTLPTAVPFILIFPLIGKTDAWLGFNVIEPGILHALAEKSTRFYR